jgi:hypothetical protein
MRLADCSKLAVSRFAGISFRAQVAGKTTAPYGTAVDMISGDREARVVRSAPMSTTNGSGSKFAQLIHVR